jgi:iron-sulfur cluster assembly accessory protein
MSLLSINTKASEKAKMMLGRVGKSVLRLSVTPSGCAGMSYQFGPEEAPAPSDIVVEADGFKIVVDRKSFLYVAGSEITYDEGLMSAGFRLNNPNAQGCCSCGTSFSIEPWSGEQQGCCSKPR